MTGNPGQSDYSFLTGLIQLGVDPNHPLFFLALSFFFSFKQGLGRGPSNPEPAEPESILSWNKELPNVSKQHYLLPCNCETYAIETTWYFALFVKHMATETLKIVPVEENFPIFIIASLPH